MIKTAEIAAYLKERGIYSYNKKDKYLYCLDGYLLKGIYFQTTTGHFYINSFYIPLVVPTSILFFNYGNRLVNPINNNGLFRNEHFLNAKDQILSVIFNAVKEQEKVNGLHDFWNLSSRYREHDTGHYERLSYIEFLLNPERKEEIIFRIGNKMKEYIPIVTAQWQQDIFDRIGILKEKSVGDAKLQIEAWKNESIKSLKIR